jgi:hypothetical protein
VSSTAVPKQQLLTVEILQLPVLTSWLLDEYPTTELTGSQAGGHFMPASYSSLHRLTFNWIALNCKGSSLYSLGADRTENTASNNPSTAVMGSCLATDWISFPLIHVYQPLWSSACSFLWSLHSDGTTHYSMKPDPSNWNCWVGFMLLPDGWSRASLQNIVSLSRTRWKKMSSVCASLLLQLIVCCAQLLYALFMCSTA